MLLEPVLRFNLKQYYDYYMYSVMIGFETSGWPILPMNEDHTQTTMRLEFSEKSVSSRSAIFIFRESTCCMLKTFF